MSPSRSDSHFSPFWSFPFFLIPCPSSLPPVPQLCSSHLIYLVVTVLEVQLRLCSPGMCKSSGRRELFHLPWDAISSNLLSLPLLLLSACLLLPSSSGFCSVQKGQNEPQGVQCTAIHCRQQHDVKPRNPNSNVTVQIRRKIPKKQERQHTKVPAIGSLQLY